MKWFLRLPKLARLTIALCVAAGMFVLIWQMAKHRKEAEAVWDDRPRHWQPPITVGWDEHVWDEHNGSFNQAVSAINAAAGCDLLRVVLDEGPATVRIVSADGEPCGKAEALVADPGHAAQAYLCPDGTAEIHVYQPGDVTMSMLIVEHELGHVLGLAHDGRYRGDEMFVSVMTPDVAEHAGRLGKGLRPPAVSDKDAAALRGRYCP